MPNPREIELKLDVDPSDVADLRTRVLPNLGRGGATQHLVSVYYDTPQQALRGRGISLRLRSVGTRRVQTVKLRETTSAGLFDRGEWETPVAGEHLDWDAVAATPVHRVLAKVWRSLEPVFETAVDRTVWLVQSDRATVELALDAGEVRGWQRSRPLAELELELKRGTPSDLFDLMHELNDVAVLRIGVLAKSERGYNLLDDETPGSVKASGVALQPGMRTASAFQAILHNCLRHFRLNERLLLDTRAPDALHQARVALRRLRSALSLFEPVVGDGQIEDLKERLRAASRILGEARNLDVYLKRSPPPEAETGDGRTALVVALEERRAAAYQAVETLLRSSAFRALMLDVLGWVEAGPWLTTDEPERREARDRPIAGFAAHLLGRRRRKLRKAGRSLEALDPHARHRVRIKAKQLRYAAGFFASLARRHRDGSRHATFVKAIEALQEHLGDLNDREAGRELVVAIASNGTAGGEVGFAVGQGIAAQEPRVKELMRRAQEAHGALCHAKPFWRDWS